MHSTEILEFLFHQQTSRSFRDMLRDSDSRSMCTMCRAEGVVYINIARPGQLLCKPVVVLFFFGMEAKVFEQ